MDFFYQMPTLVLAMRAHLQFLRGPATGTLSLFLNPLALPASLFENDLISTFNLKPFYLPGCQIEIGFHKSAYWEN